MDVNLNIEEKDIAYVKEYLHGKVNPVDLHDIAYSIALFKTRESGTHRIKIYSPNCESKVGDLIYKEYPGKIPVGSKKFIEMEAGVVLKVVEVRTRFGINEIKLKYDGTSEFKKYTNYLERQKIELLLPHKQNKPCEKAFYLSENNDPRKQQDPLEQRDFIHLKRKLASVLNKEADIALISNKALLKGNLKPLDDVVFDKIKEFLKENKKSEPTEFFVENFVRVKPDDEDFAAYCFSLNYRMQKDYKIDFQQTCSEGWGRWNLISVIYYTKKDFKIGEDNPLSTELKDEIHVRPTLMVGLGGTGKETLLRLRRLIIDRFGSLNNLPCVEFIHIDTDYKQTSKELFDLRPDDNSLSRKFKFQQFKRIVLTNGEKSDNYISSINEYPHVKRLSQNKEKILGFGEVGERGGQIQVARYNFEFWPKLFDKYGTTDFLLKDHGDNFTGKKVAAREGICFYDYFMGKLRELYGVVPGRYKGLNGRCSDIDVQLIEPDGRKVSRWSINPAVCKEKSEDFVYNYRYASKIAYDILDLSDHWLIPKPTTAEISHSIEEQPERECVLVCDLGGGTLDISMIDRSFSVVDVIGTGQYIDIVSSDLDNVEETERATLSRKRNLSNNIKTKIELKWEQAIFPILEGRNSVNKVSDSLLFLIRVNPFNFHRGLLDVLVINEETGKSFSIVNRLIQEITLTGNLKVKVNQPLQHIITVPDEAFAVPSVGTLAYFLKIDRCKLSLRFKRQTDMTLEDSSFKEKMGRAVFLLKIHGHITLKELSKNRGSFSSDYFIRKFREFYLIVPGKYTKAKNKRSGIRNWRKRLYLNSVIGEKGRRIEGSKMENINFKAGVYMFRKDESGRNTSSMMSYQSPFSHRRKEGTGLVRLFEGVEIVIPSDNEGLIIGFYTRIDLEKRFDFTIGGISQMVKQFIFLVWRDNTSKRYR